MPKAKNAKVDEAMALYRQGIKLVEIAKKLEVPVGTVRRWKCTYHWDGKQDSKANIKANDNANVRKRGAPIGNKNAAGNTSSAPGNQKATNMGFFARHLPAEAVAIIGDMYEKRPLDILWEQIQFAYAAIVHAQQFAYIEDCDWNTQASFLNGQARAQSELRSMIKQYDEMLHHDWEMATEEQRARLKLLQSKLNEGTDGGSVVIINDTKRDTNK